MLIMGANGTTPMATAAAATDAAAAPSGAAEHAAALVAFLRPHEWLWRIHLVDFFAQKYWEKLDPAWLPHLRRMPVRRLLLMPAGVHQAGPTAS
eukprot:SM000077S21582  [mRNA]  locus=s77:325742:326420:- [translate_table: standard]